MVAQFCHFRWFCNIGRWGSKSSMNHCTKSKVLGGPFSSTSLKSIIFMKLHEHGGFLMIWRKWTSQNLWFRAVIHSFYTAPPPNIPESPKMTKTCNHLVILGDFAILGGGAAETVWITARNRWDLSSNPLSDPPSWFRNLIDFPRLCGLVWILVYSPSFEFQLQNLMGFTDSDIILIVAFRFPRRTSRADFCGQRDTL